VTLLSEIFDGAYLATQTKDVTIMDRHFGWEDAGPQVTTDSYMLRSNAIKDLSMTLGARSAISTMHTFFAPHPHLRKFYGKCAINVQMLDIVYQL